MAHGQGHTETAVRIAASAAEAAAGLDEDIRVLYLDLIEAALSEAARKAFAMLPQNYEFQGPTFKKGKLEGQTSAVLTILQTRGLVPTASQREHILACRDLDTVKAWIAKAVTAASVDALLDG